MTISINLVNSILVCYAALDKFYGHDRYSDKLNK